jgi:glycosyltransferase involved in cell wall biosynthesis
MIIGLMMIRNEADIIAQSVPHACAVCDILLAVDCGSDDGSLELLEGLADHHPNLILAGTLHDRTPDEARCRLWRLLRWHTSWSTWWVFIDADEFIESDLRETLAQAGRAGADHLFSRHANFYYTESELKRWVLGEETIADRPRRISERRHFYVMATSMPRAFRNLPWVVWNEQEYFPRVSCPARERILYRHYQYRDWDQIWRRVETRRQAPERMLRDNPHWRIDDPVKNISSDSDPRLIEWKLGEPFQEDPLMPRLTVSAWKSALKYAAAIVSVPFRQPARMVDGESWFEEGLPGKFASSGRWTGTTLVTPELCHE